MKKKDRFAGILCIGKTQSQAIEAFRSVACGQDAALYTSVSGTVFASLSNADLYDPQTGSDLLSESAELTAKAEFVSQSSAQSATARYTVCLDGCGTHIVSESKVVSSCPHCAESLSEVTEERVEAYALQAASDVEPTEGGLVIVADSVSSAMSKMRATLASGEVDGLVHSTSGSTFVAPHKVKFDPYTGMPVLSASAAEGQNFVASVSSSPASADEVEVHVYSCSANCENSITISTDEEPVFCAHCSAPLVDDEEEEESSDEGDSTFEEDMDDMEDGIDSESSDDEEDDLSEFEDDEDEDEEEFDSESGSAGGEEDEEDEEDDAFFDENDLDDEFVESESGDEDEDDEEDDDEEDDLSEFEDDEEEEDDGDLEDEDFEDDDEDVDSESITINSVSALASTTTLDPSQLSFARAQGTVQTVHMFYAGSPVASASFNSVSNAIGEEQARRVFNEDIFIRAVSAAAHESGVEAAITQYGFNPHIVEASVSKVLARRLEEQYDRKAAAIGETIQESNSKYQERFVAALSTSLLGISKRFWNDSRNPVVESLCSNLASAGIANPRPLVERAFVANATPLLGDAVRRAHILMSKSEVAQNEIAEAVAQAAGVTAQEYDTPVEPVTSEASVKSTSGASSPTMSDFDSKLARAFAPQAR